MKTIALRNEQGAGMVEMALTVALIAIVCIAAVQEAGKHVRDKYQTVAEQMNCGAGGGECRGSGLGGGEEEEGIPENIP